MLVVYPLRRVCFIYRQVGSHGSITMNFGFSHIFLCLLQVFLLVGRLTGCSLCGPMCECLVSMVIALSTATDRQYMARQLNYAKSAGAKTTLAARAA